jgi:hypothetical protein
MPGFPKLHRNKLIVPLLCVAFAAASGCQGSEETTSDGLDSTKLNAFVSKHEREFNPAAFDADLTYLRRVETEQHQALETRPVYTTVLPDTAPGFRVQVLLTGNIERAGSVRDSIELLEPQEWTYVIFDAPYYKVRAGNFTDRSAATELLQRLLRRGFQEAWIVPDNVVLHLPPRPPGTDIVPEPRLTNGR